MLGGTVGSEGGLCGKGGMEVGGDQVKKWGVWGSAPASSLCTTAVHLISITRQQILKENGTSRES